MKGYSLTLKGRKLGRRDGFKVGGRVGKSVNKSEPQHHLTPPNFDVNDLQEKLELFIMKLNTHLGQGLEKLKDNTAGAVRPAPAAAFMVTR